MLVVATSFERSRRHHLDDAADEEKGKKGLKKNKNNHNNNQVVVVLLPHHLRRWCRKPSRKLRRKKRSDGPQIPFGDASGAALLLKDVFLAVADTDLLQEANAQGCRTKNRPRRRERVREIDVTEVHRRRALDSRRSSSAQN